jgi:DNA ligase-1
MTIVLQGKRTGVYGAYLLAIYDPESETYQTLAKLGTGFSEQVLSSLAESMAPHLIPKPPKYYAWSESLEPDVWFEPAKVWEVKAADLSISPVHKAGQGRVDPVKGISIRFPRLIRVRDDKGPEDASTAEQIVHMYQSQALTRKDVKADEGEDDD